MHSEIAEKFGVAKSTISAIATRRSWSYIELPNEGKI